MGESRGQLPLDFPHRAHFIEADFLPSDANRLALDFLDRQAGWPHGRLVLWGGPGAGKTHLLHLWARARGAAILDAPRLCEPEWPGGPLAIDDIEQAASERALLHLVNAASETGQPLLLAGSLPPARMRIGLADLASRLRATTAVEIGAADEAFLARLMVRLLADRQIRVSPAVQSWLLRRLPRTPGAVQDAVARLDRAALAAGSGVTRTLAARALAGLLHDDTAAEAPGASPPDPRLD